MSKNDERIIELQQMIANKEEAIPTNKFNPMTTCIIELDGTKYNLNVADLNTLSLLYCKLESLNIAFKSANKMKEGLSYYMIPIPEISGFTINEWLTDITFKIAETRWKAERDKLKKYKEQLDTLLSDDKKTELLLDEIMKELKK